MDAEYLASIRRNKSTYPVNDKFSYLRDEAECYYRGLIGKWNRIVGGPPGYQHKNAYPAYLGKSIRDYPDDTMYPKLRMKSNTNKSQAKEEAWTHHWLRMQVEYHFIIDTWVEKYL